MVLQTGDQVLLSLLRHGSGLQQRELRITKERGEHMEEKGLLIGVIGAIGLGLLRVVVALFSMGVLSYRGKKQ